MMTKSTLETNTWFQKTYQIVEGPLPMSWEEYESIVTHKWTLLLNSGQSEERVYQYFLEHHPCMIPGPFGLIGTSGHSPYPAAIISQPVLPDFTRKVPDFMWIARDSETIYPVMIEIESPAKPWFTKEDIQHSKLTQARDQITEWRAWFQNPLNVARLKEYYDIEAPGDNIRPLYLLVYGRRSEANLTGERRRKRPNLKRDDEFLMTYDRLLPQPGAKEFYTVRIDRKGYKALYVPPTTTLGPHFAHERAKMRGKESAVRNSLYFTDKRRDFLLSRLSYWDYWAQGPKGRKGMMSSGDKE